MNNTGEQATLFQRTIDWIKNQWIPVVILVVFTVVIAVANFLDAAHRIQTWFTGSATPTPMIQSVESQQLSELVSYLKDAAEQVQAIREQADKFDDNHVWAAANDVKANVESSGSTHGGRGSGGRGGGSRNLGENYEFLTPRIVEELNGLDGHLDLKPPSALLDIFSHPNFLQFVPRNSSALRARADDLQHLITDLHRIVENPNGLAKTMEGIALKSREIQSSCDALSKTIEAALIELAARVQKQGLSPH